MRLGPLNLPIRLAEDRLTDTRGVFRATDVVEAFHTVFGEVVSVQAIVPALGGFLLTERADTGNDFRP